MFKSKKGRVILSLKALWPWSCIYFPKSKSNWAQWDLGLLPLSPPVPNVLQTRSYLLSQRDLESFAFLVAQKSAETCYSECLLASRIQGKYWYSLTLCKNIEPKVWHFGMISCINSFISWEPVWALFSRYAQVCQRCWIYVSNWKKCLRPLLSFPSYS